MIIISGPNIRPNLIKNLVRRLIGLARDDLIFQRTDSIDHDTVLNLWGQSTTSLAKLLKVT